MEAIESAFRLTCGEYNAGRDHLPACQKLIQLCHQKLSTNAWSESGWRFVHETHSRDYMVFRAKPGEGPEGPSRPTIIRMWPAEFASYAELEIAALEALGGQSLDEQQEIKVTEYVYASVMAFACCYDIWKRKSRKSAGTFYEVFMAALMRVHLPRAVLEKHVDLGDLLGAGDFEAGKDVISINGEGDAVDEITEKNMLSTDLVLRGDTGKFAVIPLKTTTRERIVQPYAHQRILDAARPGQYKSFLCCISETQLDEKQGRDGTQRRLVKQVCVPGTVKLFQRFLASLEGLYYCDIPVRYDQPDLARNGVRVKSIGQVFNDVRQYLQGQAPNKAKATQTLLLVNPPYMNRRT